MHKTYYVLLCILATCFYACTDNDDTLTSRCGLAPDAGDCEAAIPRYYYDQEKQACKEFIWGGCGGVVPFETLEECSDCQSQ